MGFDCIVDPQHYLSFYIDAQITQDLKHADTTACNNGDP